jgi:hypothetical protein
MTHYTVASFVFDTVAVWVQIPTPDIANEDSLRSSLFPSLQNAPLTRLSIVDAFKTARRLSLTKPYPAR